MRIDIAFDWFARVPEYAMRSIRASYEHVKDYSKHRENIDDYGRSDGKLFLFAPVGLI